MLAHTILIRRLKRDVSKVASFIIPLYLLHFFLGLMLKDLPPKIRQQVFVDIADAKLKSEIAALTEVVRTR